MSVEKKPKDSTERITEGSSGDMVKSERGNHGERGLCLGGFPFQLNCLLQTVSLGLPTFP